MLIGSFVFANTNVEKPVVKTVKITKTVKKNLKKSALPPQTTWRYTCSDGIVTEFTCGCTQAQATAMGRGWCNARSITAN